MSAPVIAAYKGPAGPDVLALATVWARDARRPLKVVTVYPGHAPIGMGRTDAEWVAYNHELAHRFLDEAKVMLGETDATFSAVGSLSASRGLHEVMEADGPGAVVVVGSRKTRGVRRTAPGSTAERLLHGAPCPVCIVPWDYERFAADPIRRITVAYVDTPDARAALNAAIGMARELGAGLQLLSVIPDTRVVPAFGDVRRFGAEQRAAYQETLEAAAADVPEGIDCTTELRDGPVVETLADIHPQDTDVLVCGSRGYGPARRVLLGGVSSRLLRHARVPVLIAPRTHEG
jgi:nucleotide-binding universal stress UspA family protein